MLGDGVNRGFSVPRKPEPRLAAPSRATGTFPYYQRDYSSEWKNASSYERILLAERIGEQGRKRLVEETVGVFGKVEQRLGYTNRTTVTGPDSGYWLSQHDSYLVVEAKGGASVPQRTFGALQGTNLNTLRSAADTFSRSGVSAKEKLEYAIIIKAAQRDRLITGVSSTRHSAGRPALPQWKGDLNRDSVRQEACMIEARHRTLHPQCGRFYDDAENLLSQRSISSNSVQAAIGGETSPATFRARPLAIESKPGVHQLRSDGEFAQAGTGIARTPKLSGMVRAGAGIGMAASVFAAGNALAQWQPTYEAWHDPSFTPFDASMQTTHTGIRTYEALALAANSSSVLARSFGFSSPWLGIGQRLGTQLPLVFGIGAALEFGVAYNDYQARRISHSEFIERTSSPAVMALCVGGGACIGAGVGAFSTGGVGAVPGAVSGAQAGSMVAIPATIAINTFQRHRHAAFDAAQRKLVDSTLQAQYDTADLGGQKIPVANN